MVDNKFKIKIAFISMIWFVAGFIFYYITYVEDFNVVKNIASIALMHKHIIDHDSRYNKVIIAGGSNALCGISAEELSSILGRPTYNISLQSEALDYKNMLALIETTAKPGDLVIYSSANVYGNIEFGKRAPMLASYLANTIDNYVVPDYLSKRVDIHWLPFPKISLLSYAKKVILQENKLSVWENPNSYDIHGDMVAVETVKKIPTTIYKKSNVQEDKFIHDLEIFNRKMNANGITVVYAYPWALIKVDDRILWEQHLNHITQAIEGFGGIVAKEDINTVLNTDSSYFADTNFHLKREYAKERAKSIGDILGRSFFDINGE